MRVLLIEDDHVLGAAIRDYVLSIGHAVDWMLLRWHPRCFRIHLRP